jgi:hypothetical protein
MSTMNEKTSLCLKVEESLADVLDGSADAALYEHIADCDDCRDLRHDGERAAEVVKHAGADFRAPPGFAESLVAKIDAARPQRACRVLCPRGCGWFGEGGRHGLGLRCAPRRGVGRLVHEERGPTLGAGARDRRREAGPGPRDGADGVRADGHREDGSLASAGAHGRSARRARAEREARDGHGARSLVRRGGRGQRAGRAPARHGEERRGRDAGDGGADRGRAAGQGDRGRGALAERAPPREGGAGARARIRRPGRPPHRMRARRRRARR